MRKITKLMLAMAFPVAVLAGGNANAGTMITDWNYENLFGFSAFSPAGVTGSNANGFSNFSIGSLDANPTFGDPTKLSWGTSTGSGQSSLTLGGNNGTGRTSGTVQTNGLDVFDVSLTHNNFPITGTTLATATLVGSLMLESTLPAPLAGIPIGPLTGHFAIVFKETVNALSDTLGGPLHCADSIGDSSPCPDIFVIDQAASSDLTNVPLGVIDGIFYSLSVNIDGLLGVGPQACAAVGQAPGCLGFITQEGQASTLALYFSIDGRPVPEPATLALLGLGLAGLGFSRVRRSK